MTILGDPPRELNGWIVNESANGLRLRVLEAIPGESLLKIEYGETVLLGEVCYCYPQSGGYAVGLQVEHALRQTEELARLAQRLREEADDSSCDTAPVRDESWRSKLRKPAAP